MIIKTGEGTITHIIDAKEFDDKETSEILEKALAKKSSENGNKTELISSDMDSEKN